MEEGRGASHAGSWYTENPKKLTEECLRASGLTKSPEVKWEGVISPHAGIGHAAAYTFGNINPTTISRVFLLGPSRQHYTPKCALSMAPVYKTPIGDLPVDLEVIEELKATGKFEMMNIRVDEAEHCMEMHLLYLAKVFEGHPIKVVPILVGALNAEIEAMYGLLLVKYMIDPNNFFSVLTDFCRGGARFNYMYYNKKHGAAYKYIEALDSMGIDKIEPGDPDAFKQYLLEYENTIYGRHPIGGFLYGRGQGIPLFPRPRHSESSSMASRHSSMEELAVAALPSSSSMTCRRFSIVEHGFARGRLSDLRPKRNADEEPLYRRRRIDPDSTEEPRVSLAIECRVGPEYSGDGQSLVMESQGSHQPFSLGVAQSTQHPPPPLMESQGTQPPSAAPSVHNCPRQPFSSGVAQSTQHPPPPVMDSQDTQPPFAAPTAHNCQSSGGVCIHIANCMGIYFS